MGALFLSILAATLAAPLDQTVVSPAWLERNLTNPNVVILQIGSDGAFAQQRVHNASWPHGRHPHIPGARFVPIEAIVDRNRWPLDELPPVRTLQDVFEQAGIGDEKLIIIYSENPLWAARAWFTLDVLGHGHRAAILDGGFDRWNAEQRLVQNERFKHTARPFTVRYDPTRVIARADLAAAIESDDVILIDARPQNEFEGVERGRRVARAGHIPGAHCRFWRTNLTESGALRPAAELRADYAQLAGTPQKRVVVYCRTGMEASMPYLILRSLGYDVALYDGSYTDWARDRVRPVTKLAMNP